MVSGHRGHRFDLPGMAAGPAAPAATAAVRRPAPMLVTVGQPDSMTPVTKAAQAQERYEPFGLGREHAGRGVKVSSNSIGPRAGSRVAKGLRHDDTRHGRLRCPRGVSSL